MYELRFYPDIDMVNHYRVVDTLTFKVTPNAPEAYTVFVGPPGSSNDHDFCEAAKEQFGFGTCGSAADDQTIELSIQRD